MKNKLYCLVFLCSIILTGCQTNLDKKTAWNPDTQILYTPVKMYYDTLTIHNIDYVTDVSEIENVNSTNSEIEVSVSENKRFTKLTIRDKEVAKLSAVNFKLQNITLSVPIFYLPKTKVQFQYFDSTGSVQKVQIKGEMNAWNPARTDFRKTNNEFKSEVYVSPGNYQYLLVIDGEEKLDPANNKKISNNMGGWNSLLSIPDYKTDKPRISTSGFSNTSVYVSVKNEISKWLVLWNNEIIDNTYFEVETSKIKIPIPKASLQVKRSYIRIYGENNFGISNDVLIPLHYGKVLESSNNLNRRDKYAQILYFLMVDRFNNGNSENDFPIDSSNVHPRADYHGGDLTGVLDKINDEYFRNLGCNTIWLSPITQNPTTAYGLWPNPRTEFSGYHGYWPISSSQIDFHFGTDSDLMELVKTAHSENTNILLDYVANHVHEDHPAIIKHPDWKTELYLPDGSLNIERWDDHRLTTWFDTFLPTLDFSKPEVVETMTDSALYWLKKFHLDGFRHDATKHIQNSFWRTLTYKIKSEVTYPVYQIGETYGSRPLIASYINSGLLDAQFDFNVYDDAVATFALDNVSFERLSTSISESHNYYGEHNLMGYITGNQDRARVISYMSGDVKFDENAKEAGWTRNIIISDSSAFNKVFNLFMFNFTIPGVPCIYYGDEIGMPGGNDPDNRRMMRFENLTTKETDLRNKVSKLAKVRLKYISLIYGDFEEVHLTNKLWIYSRNYFDETAFTLFNKSEASESIDIPLKEGNKQIDFTFFNYPHEFSGNKLTVQLPANSCELIILK